MSVPQKSALVAQICFQSPIPQPYSDNRFRSRQGSHEHQGQGANGCTLAAQGTTCKHRANCLNHKGTSVF
jgi:hypothetical protein